MDTQPALNQLTGSVRPSAAPMGVRRSQFNCMRCNETPFKRFRIRSCRSVPDWRMWLLGSRANAHGARYWCPARHPVTNAEDAGASSTSPVERRVGAGHPGAWLVDDQCAEPGRHPRATHRVRKRAPVRHGRSDACPNSRCSDIHWSLDDNRPDVAISRVKVIGCGLHTLDHASTGVE